jgi:pyridoxine 5'-phosphate synthase PdxJ
VILNDISGLRKYIQEIEMQKASDRIEMQSTAKEIADTEVKIRDKLNNDRIMVELEKIVKIHEEQRKRLAIKGTPEPETAEAGEKLARARIELAKRRQEISRAEGGNRVSQLSSKLAQYTRQMAQYELSLSSTKDQLKEAMDFLDRADNYELLSLKADIARESLQEALLWLERMERKARSIQPPAVTVLGGS